MKRAFVYLTALVGLGGVTYLAGQGIAQPPAAPAPKAGGKVAVFNVMKVLKDYGKFQHFVGTMTAKKQSAMGPLSNLRSQIMTLQDQLQKEPLQAKKDELQRTLVQKSREFEDAERKVTAELDTESATYLRTVYYEIQQCVKAIVDANGYDLVMAYPDATDPKEMENPLYFNAKLRSTAAMPFFVGPQADMTEVLVLTLNKNFPAPVAQAGAAAPAAPPGAPQPPK